MNPGWNPLVSLTGFDEVLEISYRKPVAIFKHSTRCSLSSVVLNRLINKPLNQEILGSVYLLDLLAHRPISDKISNDLQVHHESPQILLLRNGTCVFNASHNGITADKLQQEFKKAV
jgi:bacillithiol system protein YtxJ